MRKKITIVALLVDLSGFAQSAADYKYIVVPLKFTIFKEANMYNLNALTKSVFEQQGYEVYYENETFPQELAENRCKALFADMIENNSLFTTKIKIELKDCKNQVLYASAQGESREKDYAKAYVQAFRAIGKSIGVLKSKPKQSAVQTKVEPETKIANTNAQNLLFAQATATGFQLIDNTPKVVMRLFRSSLANCYIAQKDNVQGVVIDKGNQWFFEYYQGEILVSEKLEIKF